MARGTELVVLLVLSAGAVAPGQAMAQAAEAALPAEVRDWMERDQVQRWAALISEGDSIFTASSCVRCHGEAGAGGRFGPDLTDSTWVQSDGSLEGIRRTIFWGVRRELLSDPAIRFEMNPGGGADLSWDQYSALAAYIWSRSNGTHLPGR